MAVFTFESQGINTYLVYEIGSEDVIDTLSLGMITNNNISGFAPVLFTQMNNQKYIKYNISAKVSIKQFFIGSVTKNRLLGVFSSIITALLAADDYMINNNSLLLDLDYIYADVSTYNAILICLPVINVENKQIDYGQFFKNIVFETQFNQSENCDYVAKLINYLNSAQIFSLVDFKGIVKDLMEDNKSFKQEKVSAQPTPTNPVFHTEMQQITPAFQNTNQSFGQQSSGINIQAKSVSGIPQTPILQSSDKIKREWSIFGKNNKIKKDKPLNDKKTKDKPQKVKKMKNVDYNYPGAPVMPLNPNISGTTPPNQPPNTKNKQQLVQGTAAQQPIIQPQRIMQQQPMQQQPMQQQPMQQPPIQQPIIQKQPNEQSSSTNQQVQTNFGETVVLGRGSAIGETSVLGVADAIEIMPYLIRTKNKEKIKLIKPVFRIGKEKSYVDYFIGDNPAVSRSHANIIIRDSEYFIVDTNSTNHTFINGTILQSNMETKIVHGTKIRLANEEFDFKVF